MILRPTRQGFCPRYYRKPITVYQFAFKGVIDFIENFLVNTGAEQETFVRGLYRERRIQECVKSSQTLV